MFQKINSNHFTEIFRIFELQSQSNESFERFGLGWSKELLELSVSKDICFGWFEEKKLVSFVLGRRLDEKTFEIDMTMTDPKSLKKDFMKKLFNEMRVQLLASGFDKVWLEVHEQNEPAVRFYKKMGFKEDSKRAKYYPDGKGALLMSLLLKTPQIQ